MKPWLRSSHYCCRCCGANTSFICCSLLLHARSREKETKLRYYEQVDCDIYNTRNLNPATYIVFRVETTKWTRKLVTEILLFTTTTLLWLDLKIAHAAVRLRTNIIIKNIKPRPRIVGCLSDL